MGRERGKIHSKIHELAIILRDTGVIGISGGTFRRHTRPNGTVVEANTTVGKYCIEMGKMHGVSGDTYANELLNIQYAIRDGKCTEIRNL